MRARLDGLRVGWVRGVEDWLNFRIFFDLALAGVGRANLRVSALMHPWLSCRALKGVVQPCWVARTKAVICPDPSVSAHSLPDGGANIPLAAATNFVFMSICFCLVWERHT